MSIPVKFLLMGKVKTLIHCSSKFWFEKKKTKAINQNNKEG